MQKNIINIIKYGGEKEPFDKRKLEYSLVKAGASSASVSKILEHVENELKEEMTTSQIYSHAFFLLRKLERPASLKYSLKRAIMELGPTGFPFEAYVAEIFRSRGFEALVGEHVQGKCVVHEVDVVAYNDKKLIMSEIKFHNEPGLSCDLKVALYVKARFDDLRGVEFDYGKPRTLDEGWLITNTKFTSTALEYGMCNGIHMIGWNFPEKGNLQDMIEDGDLHPITCLKSISARQAKSLVEQKIVLCKDLAGKDNVLRSIGLNDDDIKDVMQEISLL